MLISIFMLMTVIYCFAPTLNQVIENLQNAFIVVQNTLHQLKLVLNADKTKLMLFTSSRARPQNVPSVVTLEGSVIQVVTSYRYLGFLIDDSLTFEPLVRYLVKKLRLKLFVFFRNKMCFSFNVKKRLVAATFLSVMDYGDLLYMHTSVQCLNMIDLAYHSSLRFITNCKARTHHCQLYSQVGWPALSSRRLSHYCIFIYKAILGVLPSYVCSLITRKSVGPHFLCLQDLVLLSVPNVRTEQGKKAFVYSAPTVWNTLQKDLGLVELISLNAFKLKMKEIDSLRCQCFKLFFSWLQRWVY